MIHVKIKSLKQMPRMCWGVNGHFGLNGNWNHSRKLPQLIHPFRDNLLLNLAGNLLCSPFHLTPLKIIHGGIHVSLALTQSNTSFCIILLIDIPYIFLVAVTTLLGLSRMKALFYHNSTCVMLHLRDSQGLKK